MRKRGQERAAKPFSLGGHPRVVHFLREPDPFDRDCGLVHERVEKAPFVGGQDDIGAAPSF